MNAATRQDVVLMSTATPLGFATSTKTVNLQLENTKIIFFAQKVRKNCNIFNEFSNVKFKEWRTLPHYIQCQQK